MKVLINYGGFHPTITPSYLAQVFPYALPQDATRRIIIIIIYVNLLPIKKCLHNPKSNFNE